MLVQGSTAAATAVIGFDLMDSAPKGMTQVSYPRRLIAAGISGSAAALDTEVSIKIGNEEVGRLFNSATGAVIANQAMFRVGAAVPPNTPVILEVIDAPATNPINFAIDIT